MAAPTQAERRLQPGGPAAHHQHPPRLLRRCQRELPLASHKGIDRAAQAALGNFILAAGAADTAPDGLLLPPIGLLCPAGVGQQPAAKPDELGAPLQKELLGHARLGDPPAGEDGDAHRAADLVHGAQVEALRLVIAREFPFIFGEGAGIDVQQVDPSLL